MAHQAEDVDRLRHQPRINVFNGLGTGKTATAAWWLMDLWLRDVVDEVLVVGPSMVIDGWYETFTEKAWPGEMVEFIDARPPDQEAVAEALKSGVVPHPGRLRVMFTTYGTLRDQFAMKYRRAWHPEPELLSRVRGRRTALIVDESQNVALPGSGQQVGAAALATACRAVASVTATPIGNPKHLRMWGLTKLVRPDLLLRLPPHDASALGVAEPGTFDAFKARYAFLHDPMEEKAGSFKLSRAFVADVYQDRIRNELLAQLAPFTCRRAKEECLDLPPKIRSIRSVQPTEYVAGLFRGLAEDDRAILEDGHSVVPANVLEEKLRCLELAGGWLEGRPVHTLKLELLQEVLEEIDESCPGPKLVWASRTKEVVAAALVAGAVDPALAMTMATDPARYHECVHAARLGGVGVIHGPTSERERDRIQSDWRRGYYHTVVAHPGVAGAGLNWQHVVASVYYSQPLGTIARQQSEDRVHRHGLDHKALYFDLVLEDGPDRTIAAAHAGQRDTELELLAWLRSRLEAR